jgi:SPP1 family predicted phage head-tail adaptor
MRAGQLRHRVTIQRLVEGSPQQDAGGTPDDAWSEYFTCYAEVAPLRGRELIAAQQVNSEVTGTIRIRYRDDKTVTTAMRAVFESRNFDILAVVDPLERHRELVLYVKEGPNVG